MKLKDIQVVAEPYNALPCEDSVFSVNGVAGSKSDFGYNEDVGSFDYEYGEWADENWACADNQFVPHDSVDPEVLDRYGINEAQYREVQDQLTIQFCVGSCGWCV